jgi:hypothetical protein
MKMSTFISQSKTNPNSNTSKYMAESYLMKEIVNEQHIQVNITKNDIYIYKKNSKM